MTPLFSNEIEVEIRAALERLLASRSFSLSERQSRLLRFLVEETLGGRGALLKESVVGVEVFGKAIDYDPKVDSTVRSEVVKLRSRLGDYYSSDGLKDPWQIRIPKGTYVPTFERAEPMAETVPEPVVVVEEPAPVPQPARSLPWRTWLVIGLVIFGVGAVLVFRHERQAQPERPSLAVLPFRLLTPSAEHEYLGTGMADALITRLTNQQHIDIRPTSRVIAHGNADPMQAGRDLKVDYVMEGTLRTSEGRLRLNVQLISVRKGAPTWGSTFDEDLNDVFRVEDSLSRHVADALQEHLTTADKDRVGRPLTTDAEAHRLYLQARYHSTRFTDRGGRRALELYRQATQRDPRFAHAWAGITEVILNWCLYQWAPTYLPEARQAAQRAVELAPELTETQVSLALTKFFYDWDWAGAELTFRKAIELNEKSVRAHDWYGQYLSQMGRYVESRRHLARAIELDPDDLVLRVNLALVLFFEGKYAKAAKAQEAVLAVDPNFFPALAEAARSWTLAGEHEKAQTLLERARAVEDLPWVRVHMARLRAHAGDRKGAREMLAAVEADGTHYLSPAIAAMGYEALGDRERGLDLLSKAVAERSPWITFFRVDPSYAGLRTDSRFHEIAARAGW